MRIARANGRICTTFVLPQLRRCKSAGMEWRDRLPGCSLMALETIQMTTVYVQDQDAALNFYVNKLGMEKRMDNVFGPGIRFLVVAPKESATGIVLQAGQQNNMPVGGFTGLVFGSSDIEGTYQE